PPGGRIKYAFSQLVAGRLEPWVIRQAAKVISVSPDYIEVLQERYAWFRAGDAEVLPFGASDRDFELLDVWKLKQSSVELREDERLWAYVGRGGSDMHRA